MKVGISVIIPTFNREKFISEAIQSVLDQEFEGTIEIIISDDGSTDRTLEVIESFGEKIKILKKPTNCKTQGVSGARNRGIKASTQPLICFLDSDDFYLPGRLKKMMAILISSPDIGFIFCRILETKEENGIRLYKKWTHQYILKNDIKNPVVSRSKIVHTNSFIFRREVFDTVGFFNETYSNGEDGDQWMRISEQFKGAFLDHFGTVYRTHHEINQLTKNSGDQINKCALLIFEEAKKRYYDLNLNDQKRIFKIKYTLIWLKYRAVNNAKFSFKYLILIFQYPGGFFQKLIEYYFDKKEKGERGNWEKLEKYIS